MATTLTEFILVYYKRKAAGINDDHILPEYSLSKSMLSSMEIAGIQYLGGYGLYNLHRKLKSSSRLDS